jgi:ribose transport system permease protein
MVVLIGGIDLSIGAVVSLSTAILVIDAPPYVVIPAVFCAAALVGLVNGLTVAKLKVHPIIATLSTMGVVQGVTLILRPVAGGIVPGVINHSVTSDFLGLPMPLFWSLAALLAGWKLVHASRYGLHLFAVGGGKDFASSYGINVNRVSVNAYILSSLFAAAAGIFLAARIASGDPKVGDLFAIDSITAVALGGVQLAGGIGSVAGAAAGSVLLALLANGMNLENLSAYIQTGIRGVILLSVIALQPRKNIGL